MSQTAHARRAEQIQDDFAQAVLEGLGKESRSISCSYLYDDCGSVLFEQITQVEEYYPTRTEISLLENYASEIARIVGPGATLIEFGSGSSRKTRILIEALDELAAYVPIDISDGALAEAEEKLKGRYPRLVVVPHHADFTQPMDLPEEVSGTARVGFFPGSTIGNFSREMAVSFLSRASKLLGKGNGLVIGVDLKKDTETLEAAYNDAAGVTADFNLNLLDRINRELDGDFDRSKFRHRSIYNVDEGRIESFIESQVDQTVSVLGETFDFAKGERMHTENSHKYSVEDFKVLAKEAGWESEQVWVDDNQLFSVHYLRAV